MTRHWKWKKNFRTLKTFHHFRNLLNAGRTWLYNNNKITVRHSEEVDNNNNNDNKEPIWQPLQQQLNGFTKRTYHWRKFDCDKTVRSQSYNKSCIRLTKDVSVKTRIEDQDRRIVNDPEPNPTILLTQDSSSSAAKKYPKKSSKKLSKSSEQSKRFGSSRIAGSHMWSLQRPPRLPWPWRQWTVDVFHLTRGR